MTRTTWRSICHARAVTIALSLVKQSMDLGCAKRSYRRLSRYQKYRPRETEMRKTIFRGLTSASVPKMTRTREKERWKYTVRADHLLSRPSSINSGQLCVYIFVTGIVKL